MLAFHFSDSWEAGFLTAFEWKWGGKRKSSVLLDVFWRKLNHGEEATLFAWATQRCSRVNLVSTRHFKEHYILWKAVEEDTVVRVLEYTEAALTSPSEDVVWREDTTKLNLIQIIMRGCLKGWKVIWVKEGKYEMADHYLRNSLTYY